MIDTDKLREAKIVQDVLDCDLKDETGLNDFQKLPDVGGIAIPKVGINRYRIPLTLNILMVASWFMTLTPQCLLICKKVKPASI
jgi:hypothetical protein